MVRLKPDVVLATAIITAVAVRKLTSTIPVVADAVRLGLITSEARPGPWRIGYQRCLGIPIIFDPVDWSAMASICLGAIIVPPIS